MKAMKKMLAGLLAAAVAASCLMTAYAAGPSETVPPAVGTTARNETAQMAGGVTTKVDTSKSGIAALDTIEKTNKTSVKVQPYVTVNGVKYTLTIIRNKAFENCQSAKKVTLPGTLKLIMKNAFKGAKSLKTIVLNGRTAPTIRKGAFKGLATKKMVVRMNNTKMTLAECAKLVSNLKGAGFKGTLVAKGAFKLSLAK